MIDSKTLPELKKNIETLTNQLSLFEDKVKNSPEIEPGDKGPEEERKRILSLLASYQKKLPEIEKAANGPLLKNSSNKIDLSAVLINLEMLDQIFKDLKQDPNSTYKCNSDSR